MTYKEMKQHLTEDRSVSFWLKNMIAEIEANSRDPVDTLGDIAILHKLQRLKVDELLGNA